MNRLLVLTSVSSVMLLAGCTTVSPDPEVTGTVASSAAAGATTIQEVWAKIGCDDDGRLDVSAPNPPVDHTGMCTPYEGGELVFFYQLPSADEAADWLRSGKLEIGARDAVFTDGAVVILATDASSAQKFGELFIPQSSVKQD
ncbi:hypothetical protein FB472_0047 [Rhodoglobus vestalii]|uniref:LppP/LprE lipoprotein n=1 Tax=Rhodoglobus vestalii TaxID=193384 RepID=A0A8H2K3L0_9MICO|nr:hypothetical protein [Rhodoglobus vestalii]TQO18530.1 hypothetical protein FB472_0047 [Rhodoglobus vestalii]